MLSTISNNRTEGQLRKEKLNVTLRVTMSCFNICDAESFELLESDPHLGNSFHTRKKKQKQQKQQQHLSRNLEFDTFQRTKFQHSFLSTVEQRWTGGFAFDKRCSMSSQSRFMTYWLLEWYQDASSCSRPIYYSGSNLHTSKIIR